MKITVDNEPFDVYNKTCSATEAERLDLEN